MDKFFKLKEHGTDVRTEFFAGITTFMTMAYIIVVNPNILSVSGMEWDAVFTATIIAAIIGTVLMALLANYPFALAPGMGLNAFFVYAVALNHSWQLALTAVLVEGFLFIILTFVNVREALFNAIPLSLKYAVSAGIGLFIAFIGFKGAGIVVDNPVTLVQVNENLTSASIVIAVIGILITGILVVKKVKGSILIGILVTWGIAIIAELTHWYVPNVEAGLFSVIPTGFFSAPPSLASIAFKFEFGALKILDFWVIVVAFLFVDLFDTLGTLIGVSSKAGYLTEDGKLPKAKQALLADAVATTAGACLGTSTTTTYIESAAGVADGGRTGLTALTTAALFALALPFSPIFKAIPAFATAPALIIVGFYMMESVIKIDFSKYRIAIPAFLTILIMPITYSISEGISFGVISYTIINACTGNAKKVHPLMYVLSLLFILKYIFI